MNAYSDTGFKKKKLSEINYQNKVKYYQHIWPIASLTRNISPNIMRVESTYSLTD